MRHKEKRVISKLEYDILVAVEEDIVLSTVQIDRKNKPVFLIKALPSQKELSFIDKEVQKNMENQVSSILRFFDERLFSIQSYRSKEAMLKE